MCAWSFELPEAVRFAAAGGLSVKLLDLAELVNVRRANWPKFDLSYILLSLIHPALGGFLAYAYFASQIEMRAIVAVNVGISAPLILRAMANRSAEKVIPQPEGA